MALILPPGNDFIELNTRSKIALRADWPNLPSLTHEQVYRIIGQGGNYGCRPQRRVNWIDVDPRNGGTLAALNFDVWDYPVASTGGSGFHILGTTDTDDKLRHSHKELYPGTEFQDSSHYVVGVGSIHPNGSLYRWNDFSGPIELKPFPKSFIDSLRIENRTHSGGGSMTVEALEAFLVQMNAEDFDDNDSWFALMCACHEATDGEGVDAFIGWSTSDPIYMGHDEIIRQRWNSLEVGGSSNAGLGTLLHIGKNHGVKSISADTSEFAQYAQPVEVWTAPPKYDSDDMNKRFHAVRIDGKLRILECRIAEDTQESGWIHHTRRDFIEVCEAIFHYPPIAMKVTDDKGKDKTRLIPMAERWLQVDAPGKRVFQGGLVFMPEVDKERVGEALNMWRGFAFKPAAGSWALLQQLIFEILCRADQRSYDYVLDWMARAVQLPHIPARTAVVFRGIKGVGKGTLGRAFIKLFGIHGKHITSMGQITGRFNSHLQDTVAMFADEAYWAGDKSAVGQFQALITEPKLQYEAKGLNSKQGRNLIHIMMASNADWVVPASLEYERRYAVFEPLEIIKGAEFFNMLNFELEHGGYEAMLYDLMHRDISKFTVGNIPITAALAEQKLESMELVEQWVFRILNGNKWGDTVTIYDEGGQDYLLLEDAQKDYERFAGNRKSPRSTDVTVGIAFRRLIPNAKRMRIIKPVRAIMVLTDRPYAYALPRLDEAKAHFCDKVGFNVFA